MLVVLATINWKESTFSTINDTYMWCFAGLASHTCVSVLYWASSLCVYRQKEWRDEKKTHIFSLLFFVCIENWQLYCEQMCVHYNSCYIWYVLHFAFTRILLSRNSHFSLSVLVRLLMVLLSFSLVSEFFGMFGVRHHHHRRHRCSPSIRFQFTRKVCVCFGCVVVVPIHTQKCIVGWLSLRSMYHY